MSDALFAGHGRLVNPVDRVSEILFGLIMAVTIVGSLSVAEAGRNDVRTTLAAALGCNLAWGLVDAVMYLVRTLTERTRNLALAKRMVSDPDQAYRLIAESLPPEFAAIIGTEQLASMRPRLPDSSLPLRATLRRDDYLTALGIFILVVVATFPVVLPFMVWSDAGLAMNISRATAVAMLFLCGFELGRYAGHARPARTGLVSAAFGVLLIAAVKALGG